MFKAVLTQVKRSGKGDVQHKEVISESDMEKLMSSGVLNTNEAQGLQFKVFIDIMFYTCRRGRENLRKMQSTYFILKSDVQGRKYFQNIAKYESKNHRGDDMRDDNSSGARIYEIPGNPQCPVTSLEKYLSKLNPSNISFWQRPKRVVKEDDIIWYDNAPVGHNTLGKFMSRISSASGLSQIYTNHCIRATCITTLDQRGVKARHIMSVSGHKSETSIKSYASNVSEEKKHEMCSVLQSVLIPQEAQGSSSEVLFQDCEIESVSEQQLLNEMLQGSDKENIQSVQKVTKSKTDDLQTCGPVFQQANEVHIHYHFNK